MKAGKEHFLSEFEIQSYVFNELTAALKGAFLVRSEVSYRGCRFDIAIFDATTRKIVCTIECKKRRGNKNKKLATINQLNRYQRATGKPCILVTEKNMRTVVGALRTRLQFPKSTDFAAPTTRLLRQMPNGTLVEIP